MVRLEVFQKGPRLEKHLQHKHPEHDQARRHDGIANRHRPCSFKCGIVAPSGLPFAIVQQLVDDVFSNPAAQLRGRGEASRTL